MKRHSGLTCPNCHSKVFIEKKPELLARIVMAIIIGFGVTCTSFYFRGQLLTIMAVAIAFALLGRFVYMRLLKLYIID
ncbi:hypothetical protein JNM05_12290 [bacterium]|nr:hypothetical protein [bacterium]